MEADILEVRGELDEALRIRREEELPVYEREVKHGDEPPQESMRIIDRQILSRRIRALPAPSMSAVDSGLRLVLGL